MCNINQRSLDQNKVTIAILNYFCYPLQLIKKPIVKDSRVVNPVALAAIAHPTILPKHAKKMTKITYPHTVPVFNNPICVLSPDNVKYYFYISIYFIRHVLYLQEAKIQCLLYLQFFQ